MSRRTKQSKKQAALPAPEETAASSPHLLPVTVPKAALQGLLTRVRDPIPALYQSDVFAPATRGDPRVLARWLDDAAALATARGVADALSAGSHLQVRGR